MENQVTLEYLGAASIASGSAKLISGARRGVRHLALPSGGPVDPPSAAFANELLGNPPGQPLIEVPLVGGTWRIQGDCRIALTGADMHWEIDGQPVAPGTARDLRDSNTLVGRAARSAVFAYFALNGRWSKEILSSRELLLGGNIKIGKSWSSNLLACVDGAVKQQFTAPGPGPVYDMTSPINVYPGPEWTWLSPTRREGLLTARYEISTQSNRQGLRLLPQPNTPNSYRDHASELLQMISSPVLPGTVQLTPAGPIILGPDAHTVGGYPRILMLAPGELARVYQFGFRRAFAFHLQDFY
ncbi:5-oxoprolinase subunit C family protein [Neolewinella antarctica]|uniref:Allophanate hydrolase subunit 2 n=1 Tax=Neolewinella antarctica TaxID=442734 RepID=A0ABX0XGZ3_9BACT|nr:biotin-dependent carboxyltransferase family protein [Neolewinella antarctica]NJC28477.1 allophanate hydrolase subunit 2 [Neolewinella antarctica]